MTKRRRTDRGQAITLSYTLGLGISLILITGLLITGATFVNDQRKSAIQTELSVIGQQLAADISTADRLAQSTSDNSTVRLERSMPSTVAGGIYEIELVSGSDPHLLLSTENPDVEVRVDLVTETDLKSNSINGGHLRIEENSNGKLELIGGSR